MQNELASGVDPSLNFDSRSRFPREPANILSWNRTFSRQLHQGGKRTSRNFSDGVDDF